MQCSFAAKDLHVETLETISRVIGPDETRELIQSLVGSIEPAIAEMRMAGGAGDFASLARLAHRLAGGCGSLGAQHMQQALRTLEKAALARAGEQCEAEIARLPVLADQLRLAVTDYSTAETMAG